MRSIDYDSGAKNKVNIYGISKNLYVWVGADYLFRHASVVELSMADRTSFSMKMRSVRNGADH